MKIKDPNSRLDVEIKRACQPRSDNANFHCKSLCTAAYRSIAGGRRWWLTRCCGRGHGRGHGCGWCCTLEVFPLDPPFLYFKKSSKTVNWGWHPLLSKTLVHSSACGVHGLLYCTRSILRQLCTPSKRYLLDRRGAQLRALAKRNCGGVTFFHNPQLDHIFSVRAHAVPAALRTSSDVCEGRARMYIPHCTHTQPNIQRTAPCHAT